MVYRRTQMYTVSQKAEPKKDKMTKEELYILNELGTKPKRSVYFHINAVIVSVLPLWTFSRVLGLDVEYHALRVAIVTAITSCMIWFACNEFQLSCKGKLRKQSRKTLQEIPPLKNSFRNGKPDKGIRALLDTDRSADTEASGFALFYNNCNFIALVLLFSHIGFQKLNIEDNYVVSMTLAAFIVTILSYTLRGPKK